MNILVIGAHPDDEVLGLGGTLAMHVASGDHVSVLSLTNGEDSRDSVKDEVISERLKAFEKSCKIIGIHQWSVGEFKDQHLDTYPLVSIVKKIEHFSQTVNPDIVYIHHSGDLNCDHQIAYKAGITAFRPVGSQYPSLLLTYNTPSSTEWGGPVNQFEPNYFVDISDFIQIKLEALSAYEMEMRQFPHPRSSQMISSTAAYYGSHINVSYAEAFSIVRQIKK